MVFAQDGRLFSANSSEDQRSDADQSQIIGGDADVDHTQIIGGYIPPGFRHLWLQYHNALCTHFVFSLDALATVLY